jgi:biopolymer transport protein ExbD
MNLIPDEELKGSHLINLTPMVDFLFLVIALFATLAVTRTALFDSEVNLAKVRQQGPASLSDSKREAHIVNLSITKSGQYKWITEFNEYAMDGIQAILQELTKQQNLGLLSNEKAQTKILLHVDKKAEWDPVIQLIYALKKTGYPVHPVYETESETM